MSYNGQNLDFTSFAGCSDDNNFVRGKSNTVDDFFDIFKSEDNTGLDLQNYQYAGPSKPLVPWYLLPSQANDQGPPCTGVEVSGGPGGLSHLSDPATAPVSLYSGDQVSLDEGKSRSVSSRPLFRDSFIYRRTELTSRRGVGSGIRS